MSRDPPSSPPSPSAIESGELHSRRSLLRKSPPSSSSATDRNNAPQAANSTTTTTSSSSNNNNKTAQHNHQGHNALIKYGSLLLLVGQMVGLVLLMRYSRTRTEDGELYLASTAVFMMEVR